MRFEVGPTWPKSNVSFQHSDPGSRNELSRDADILEIRQFALLNRHSNIDNAKSDSGSPNCIQEVSSAALLQLTLAPSDAAVGANDTNGDVVYLNIGQTLARASIIR